MLVHRRRPAPEWSENYAPNHYCIDDQHRIAFNVYGQCGHNFVAVCSKEIRKKVGSGEWFCTLALSTELGDGIHMKTQIWVDLEDLLIFDRSHLNHSMYDVGPRFVLRILGVSNNSLAVYSTKTVYHDSLYSTTCYLPHKTLGAGPHHPRWKKPFPITPKLHRLCPSSSVFTNSPFLSSQFSCIHYGSEIPFRSLSRIGSTEVKIRPPSRAHIRTPRVL